MPPRRAPRAAHARPRLPDAPAALVPIHPLTPLAERERRRLRPGRRFVTILGAGLAIAAALPLLGAAMAPAAPQLRPIEIPGAVAGAAQVPAPSLTPVAPATSTSQPIHVRNPRTAGVLLAEERAAPAVATLTGYQWPIRVGRVSLPFKAIPGGEWINGGKLFHDGVDMASFCGAPVRAAHDGIVLAAGRRFDDAIGWVGDLRPYYRRLDSAHSWGNLPIVVVIDDGNGYRSIYAHFRDVSVKPGDAVRGGQVIGHEGATGHASGCHVHYGLFSPLETRTFGVRPDIVRRMKVPTLEIARIDPLAVLPGGDIALRTRNIAKAIAAAAAAAPAGDAPPRYIPPARLS